VWKLYLSQGAPGCPMLHSGGSSDTGDQEGGVEGMSDSSDVRAETVGNSPEGGDRRRGMSSASSSPSSSWAMDGRRKGTGSGLGEA
jgi:hypothetical protein